MKEDKTYLLGIVGMIEHYYDKRGLKKPDFDDAMKFVHTELAEVYELVLAGKGYIRNHPENKPTEMDKIKLGRELGDAIMMLIVAGLVEGVDPIESLMSKLQEKLAQCK